MPDPGAPLRTFPQTDGSTVPWYMVEFDRKGRVESLETRAALMAEAAGGYTDVFVFCHGWNNSWDDAVRNYEQFVSGYGSLTQEQRLAVSRPYRPLLVGIYWPSAILVAPGERGPTLFGGDVGDPDAVEAEAQALAELAAELDGADADVERFRELAGRETLDAGEAQELAELLTPVFAEDDFDPTTAPAPDELVQVWGGDQQGLGGFLVKVRDALRAATVWLMKDRAGRVGRDGLGPLLVDLMQAAPNARLHLVGHSFGCRALLAAVSVAPLPRPVNSVLLLQGAVNHRCFAIDATGDGRPGGFRPALEKVQQPILATFSDKDASLTKFFHLALRRASDLGEVQQLVAGAGPPSPYAALGGYGPGGCGDECEIITVREVGHRYELGPERPSGAGDTGPERPRRAGDTGPERPRRAGDTGPERPRRAGDTGSGARRIFGLDGSSVITGHSDVSNPATFWALWCQVSEP